MPRAPVGAQPVALDGVGHPARVPKLDHLLQARLHAQQFREPPDEAGGPTGALTGVATGSRGWHGWAASSPDVADATDVTGVTGVADVAYYASYKRYRRTRTG